jgi:hypothetical protein
MNLTTHSYTKKNGWSPQLPADADSAQTLILLFGGAELGADPAPFANLRDRFPQSIIIGCSSSGEIIGPYVQDQSWTVAVVQFTHTTLKEVAFPIENSAASFEVGMRIARELAHPDLRAVFLLSDGIHVNGSRLVAGMNRIFPPT